MSGTDSDGHSVLPDSDSDVSSNGFDEFLDPEGDVLKKPHIPARDDLDTLSNCDDGQRWRGRGGVFE